MTMKTWVCYCYVHFDKLKCKEIIQMLLNSFCFHFILSILSIEMGWWWCKKPCGNLWYSIQNSKITQIGSFEFCQFYFQLSCKMWEPWILNLKNECWLNLEIKITLNSNSFFYLFWNMTMIITIVELQKWKLESTYFIMFINTHSNLNLKIKFKFKFWPYYLIQLYENKLDVCCNDMAKRKQTSFLFYLLLTFFIS